VVLTHYRRRSSQSLQTVSNLVCCADSGSNSSQSVQISSNVSKICLSKIFLCLYINQFFSFKNDTLQTSLNKSNKIKDVWMKVEKKSTNHIYLFDFINFFFNLIEVMIDGPFSTSSRSMINAEHAILIAGGELLSISSLPNIYSPIYIVGIGVTPFASILQSLWIRYANSLKTCQSCNSQWYDDFDKGNLKQASTLFLIISQS